ncbi:MAG TPA: DUF1206 domain-containing protein [Arachnia sp.]|nr:DUF1206 domain-containing protein [Arachnia sp.]
MSDGGVIGDIQDKAKDVEHHPVAAWVAGAGHAVNGVVHAIIGGLAIGIAQGAAGSADQSGAMRAIDANPLGEAALWVAGVALFALAVYSLAVAVGEMSREKRDAAKSVGRAVMYAVVGSAALVYAMGGTADGEETTESLSAELLQSWWGSALLVVAGVVIAGIGVAMMAKGVTRSFLEDVELSPRFRLAFTALGVGGYLAKGLAVVIVGVLFVVAVFTRDAEDTGGLDGALKSLVGVPGGQAVLIAIGVGLILYGVFCIARARTTARKGR